MPAPLTRDEAEKLHAQAFDRQLLDDAHRIERTFRFRNFREALIFGQMGLAEAEGHHPDASFGWAYVAVSLRTKKIKGLHQNDSIVAARIDRLAGGTRASDPRFTRPQLALQSRASRGRPVG